MISGSLGTGTSTVTVSVVVQATSATMAAANNATVAAIAGTVLKYLLNLFILSYLQKSGPCGPNMFAMPHHQRC